jgi:hypothetical protein
VPRLPGGATDLLLVGTSGGPPLGSWAGIVTLITGVVLVALLIYTRRK